MPQPRSTTSPGRHVAPQHTRLHRGHDLIGSQSRSRPSPVEASDRTSASQQKGDRMTATDIRTLTPAQIEGPYWKPLSPERSNLRQVDTVGQPIVISGL